MLMGLLILFGAVLGVIGMIAWSKWKLEPDMANFLGGVMGAALGAGLAVMGAVYVQQRDRKDRLTGPTNAVRAHASTLASALRVLGRRLRQLDPTKTDRTVRQRRLDQAVALVAKELAGFPEGEELPRAIHSDIQRIKRDLNSALGVYSGYGVRWSNGQTTELDQEVVTERAEEHLKDLEKIQMDIETV